jgi:hypothetical protein
MTQPIKIGVPLFAANRGYGKNETAPLATERDHAFVGKQCFSKSQCRSFGREQWHTAAIRIGNPL